MKKDEVSEILIHLWGNVDQECYASEILEMFRRCPVWAQKEFIKGMVENDRWDLTPDAEILKLAKQLTEGGENHE
ncbi:hypothetical protein D3C81_1540830 [compost metagenome]